MPDKAEEYRRKAQEADDEADNATDVEAIRIYREIAEKCRQLAQFVERRRG
jgi:hypothetical protein